MENLSFSPLVPSRSFGNVTVSTMSEETKNRLRESANQSAQVVLNNQRTGRWTVSQTRDTVYPSINVLARVSVQPYAEEGILSLINHAIYLMTNEMAFGLAYEDSEIARDFLGTIVKMNRVCHEIFFSLNEEEQGKFSIWYFSQTKKLIDTLISENAIDNKWDETGAVSDENFKKTMKNLKEYFKLPLSKSDLPSIPHFHASEALKIIEKLYKSSREAY